ncbi:hypothetical protein, partial [Mycolicibacterium sp. GESEQ-9]|uniref:hypothetical protein n=1 Tax=Mycolicibacterium sp. GESEQ-9 TaxID=2812656 RepID=UPI001B32CAC6
GDAPQSWPQQPGGHGGALPEGGPGWGPQQQWAGGPLRPSNGGGKVKWLVGGLAVVLAIALVVVITVLVVKPDTGTPTRPSNAGRDGSHSEFASANDTGPIAIITEDPSCAAWRPIQDTLADSAKAGWAQRDALIPASAWSPEQREQYRAMGQAMRSAADQTVPLAKLTTHRVMRQLYEQFIAYARAYADAIPTYTPRDDSLARAANTATGVLGGICQAIRFGSAEARAPMVEQLSVPEQLPPVGDPVDPARFLVQPDPICPDWDAAVAQFANDTAAWRAIPADSPAGQWSPEQKAVTTAVVPVMRDSAKKLEELGQRSDNATFQDLAALAAQYRRAFAQAIPTYNVADNHLYDAGWRATGLIQAACAAAGS